MDYVGRAKQLRPLIEKAALSLTDDDAFYGPELFPSWSGNKIPYKKDDFIFSKEYFDELRNEVIEISKKAIYGIRNGEFKIQPVLINSKNRSCDKCPFYDVCYHDYHDNLYLEKEGKK